MIIGSWVWVLLNLQERQGRISQASPDCNTYLPYPNNSRDPPQPLLPRYLHTIPMPLGFPPNNHNHGPKAAAFPDSRVGEAGTEHNIDPARCVCGAPPPGFSACQQYISLKQKSTITSAKHIESSPLRSSPLSSDMQRNRKPSGRDPRYTSVCRKTSHTQPPNH